MFTCMTKLITNNTAILLGGRNGPSGGPGIGPGSGPLGPGGKRGLGPNPGPWSIPGPGPIPGLGPCMKGSGPLGGKGGCIPGRIIPGGGGPLQKKKKQKIIMKWLPSIDVFTWWEASVYHKKPSNQTKHLSIILYIHHRSSSATTSSTISPIPISVIIFFEVPL